MTMTEFSETLFMYAEYDPTESNKKIAVLAAKLISIEAKKAVLEQTLEVVGAIRKVI